jgi:hypothetical protein
MCVAGERSLSHQALSRVQRIERRRQPGNGTIPGIDHAFHDVRPVAPQTPCRHDPLANGVGLIGNGTHIGATANIIYVAESERSGVDGARITPARWLRVGVPVPLASLVVRA